MISVIFQISLLFIASRPSYQRCTLYEYSLSCDNIKKILHHHNEYRDNVAGGKTKLSPAMNMWQLKWDDDLAKVAQAYANKCIFEHNKGRPKGTGENLAWHADSKKRMPDMKNMIDGWYNEIDLYTFGPATSDHATGHFTQLAWADTKFVGCGIVLYEDGTHPRSPYQTLLVCDYRPQGNMLRHEPYVVFTDTRCTRGVVSQNYTNLCAHDEDHALGKYVPCSGLRLQPTFFISVFSLLYGYYHYTL